VIVTGWVVVQPLPSLNRDCVGTLRAKLLKVRVTERNAINCVSVRTSSPEPATVTLPVEVPKQATLVWELIDAEMLKPVE